jgi:hypothetical protein
MGLRSSRVLFMAKTIQYIHNTLHKVSKKYIGLHNISFETWKGISYPYQNLQAKQYPIWNI